MKKRVLTIVFALMLIMTGCSSKAAYDEVRLENSVGKDYYENQTEGSIGNSGGTDVNIDYEHVADVNRKIIVKLEYNIETKDIDKTIKNLEESVKKVGGYYENSYLSGNTENGGYAEYVLRIPTDKLESFTANVESFGNITSQNRTGKDVTTQYYDTESKLETLKIQQERVTELLKEAKTLDEILMLEKELTSIRTDIESLTTTIKKYDSLINYTSVSLNINQVRAFTIVEEPGFGEEVVETFKDSFEFAADVIKNLVLAFIWVLPYILIMTVFVGVIIVIAKSSKKRKEKKVNKESKE